MSTLNSLSSGRSELAFRCQVHSTKKKENRICREAEAKPAQEYYRKVVPFMHPKNAYALARVAREALAPDLF